MTNEEIPFCNDCGDSLEGLTSYFNTASEEEYCVFCMLEIPGFNDWSNTEPNYDEDFQNYKRIRRERT